MRLLHGLCSWTSQKNGADASPFVAACNVTIKTAR
jgi:hypothetical protein